MKSLSDLNWNFDKKRVRWGIIFFIFGSGFVYSFVNYSVDIFYVYGLLKVNIDNLPPLIKFFDFCVFFIFPFGFGIALANFFTNKATWAIDTIMSKRQNRREVK